MQADSPRAVHPGGQGGMQHCDAPGAEAGVLPGVEGGVLQGAARGVREGAQHCVQSGAHPGLQGHQQRGQC